jgi:transcriptional regulator with XRE-family HTH domain
MRIGDRIKLLRQKRRLTQVELAERAKVSQTVISRLESNLNQTVNSDVLKGLAKALGCTTDYLVGMHEDEDSERLAAAVA